VFHQADLTPLSIACQLGHIDIAKKLIAAGATVENTTDVRLICFLFFYVIL
jgi:ankyrin repeat protein